jgi:hypothetical protein
MISMVDGIPKEEIDRLAAERKNKDKYIKLLQAEIEAKNEALRITKRFCELNEGDAFPDFSGLKQIIEQALKGGEI